MQSSNTALSGAVNLRLQMLLPLLFILRGLMSR